VMIFKQTLSIGALLLAGAITLPAQNDRLHVDDSNGDGTISRNEWRGSLRDFSDLDVNHDGILSGNEVPGSRRNGSRDWGTRSRSADTDARVGRLDQNASGRIEGYEWPYNSEVFHQLDTDRDSVLSPRELKSITSVGLEKLDKNRDGRLDTNEWPGGYADFERLDQNRDGKIAASEYFDRGGEWQRRQRFNNWDSNRSGIIESTEWKSAPELFHRLDRDRDSTVSWDEFMADKERYNPPYSWR